MSTTGSAAQANPSRNVPQEFSYTAPGASVVLLAADFTHWQKAPIPLRKGANGIWRTTVSLPSGTYHYRFLVDGEWQDDPACTLRVANPYGEENSVVVVP